MLVPVRNELTDGKRLASNLFGRSSASGLQKHAVYHDLSPQNNGAHVKVFSRFDGTVAHKGYGGP